MFAQYSTHLLCHLSDPHPQRNQVQIHRSNFCEIWIYRVNLNNCRSSMWRGLTLWRMWPRTRAWTPRSYLAIWKQWPGRSVSTGKDSPNLSQNYRLGHGLGVWDKIFPFRQPAHKRVMNSNDHQVVHFKVCWLNLKFVLTQRKRIFWGTRFLREAVRIAKENSVIANNAVAIELYPEHTYGSEVVWVTF